MKKIIALMSVASVITTALFAFMAFLVRNDQLAPVEEEPLPVIEVAQTPEDSKVETKPKPVLQPPVPPTPMPRSNMAPDQVSMDASFDYQPAAIDLGGNAALTVFSGTPDSNARPVVQMPPKYPTEALSKGIEGWVLLAFDINAVGGVENVKVLDAKPKRVFDKAAKQALRKWKYRAKLVDGTAVIQKNLTVQLDFNMET
ncbi:TonB family protein [Thalassomonas viridans]|uniref:Protein TonB n=1 Tax=Thalassomonas viridans TaxID=137584 RepID=A0AAE9Z398_9GAMM|nr:TonB family protein [Thalassomonas viridans]WDE05254.1 TonB family protein [Thalassomonas viridans]